MSAFNIREDLAGRPASMQAEILAISGPRAAEFMRLLKDGNLSKFAEVTGVHTDRESAAAIVARYGTQILRPAFDEAACMEANFRANERSGNPSVARRRRKHT